SRGLGDVYKRQVPDPRLREFPGWKPLPARGSLVG
ncbi:hypothetical protein ACQUHV_26000, partial [Pseudomonas aeruginosa]